MCVFEVLAKTTMHNQAEESRLHLSRSVFIASRDLSGAGPADPKATTSTPARQPKQRTPHRAAKHQHLLTPLIYFEPYPIKCRVGHKLGAHTVDLFGSWGSLLSLGPLSFGNSHVHKHHEQAWQIQATHAMAGATPGRHLGLLASSSACLYGQRITVNIVDGGAALRMDIGFYITVPARVFSLLAHQKY